MLEKVSISGHLPHPGDHGRIDVVDDREDAVTRDGSRDDAGIVEVLQLFADRKIGREEAEDRTGLHFGEILIRMGALGIKRKPVGIHENMDLAHRHLFDEVFPQLPLLGLSPRMRGEQDCGLRTR
jgi:hypothetical protein